MTEPQPITVVSPRPGSPEAPLRGTWTPDEIREHAEANVAATVSQRRAEVQAIRDGLAYLGMVADEGVLDGGDHEAATAAVNAVLGFAVTLKNILAKARHDESYAVLCEKDPQPHPLKFHEAHTA